MGKILNFHTGSQLYQFKFDSHVIKNCRIAVRRKTTKNPQVGVTAENVIEVGNDKAEMVLSL